MKQIIISLCVVSIVFCVLKTASANIVTNGNFEHPDIGGEFITNTSAPSGFNWTITGSGGYGVDLINHYWQGISGTPNPDGYDQSVDIDFASTLSQSFLTIPGDDYYINFAYSHNFNTSQSTGHVDISGNTNLLSATLTHDVPNSSSDMKWLYFDSVFTADRATTTLTFSGEYSNGVYGFALDDVEVNPVPISGSLLFLVSGLVAFALSRLRSIR